jgi:hypothetical protein
MSSMRSNVRAALVKNSKLVRREFTHVDVPIESRKDRNAEPTQEMLDLARAAVAAGRVRFIPPRQKGRPKIWDDPVEVSEFAVSGFTGKRA